MADQVRTLIGAYLYTVSQDHLRYFEREKMQTKKKTRTSLGDDPRKHKKAYSLRQNTSRSRIKNFGGREKCSFLVEVKFFIVKFRWIFLCVSGWFTISCFIRERRDSWQIQWMGSVWRIRSNFCSFHNANLKLRCRKMWKKLEKHFLLFLVWSLMNMQSVSMSNMMKIDRVWHNFSDDKHRFIN